MRRRSCTAVDPAGRLPCGTRSRGPSRNSLRSLRSLRSNSRDESEVEARARARGHEPCVPRRRAMSLPTHTHPRLCRHHRALVVEHARAVQRGGRCPGWATCGAARSAAPGSARAQRALPLLTRRDCPSATNAVSEASFAARPRREHRSGVGTAVPTATVGAHLGYRPPRRAHTTRKENIHITAAPPRIRATRARTPPAAPPASSDRSAAAPPRAPAARDAASRPSRAPLAAARRRLRRR